MQSCVKGSFEELWDESLKESGQSMEDLPDVDPDETPVSMKEKMTLGTHEEMFHALEERCDQVLDSMSFSGSDDYAKVKEDVARGRIDFVDDPSVHELSRQIGVVQVMKDRLIEIYAEAHRNWIVRKRINECLFDAFMAVSQQKSVDKRKGEANLRLSKYMIAQAEAEAFFHYCKQIVDNLESQHKTVSRRIACASMSIAIGELNTGVSDLGIPTGKDVAELVEDSRDSGKSPGDVDWGDI